MLDTAEVDMVDEPVFKVPAKRKKRGRGKGNKQPKKELRGAEADTDSEGSLSDSGWSVCSQEEGLPVRYTAEEIKEFLSATKGYRGVQQWWDVEKVQIRVFCQQYTFTVTRDIIRSLKALETETVALQCLGEATGDLVSEPSEIRQQTVSFFSELFEKLSLGELYEALQGMENGRAPGIDGLPVEFYKAFWSVLGQDVLEVLLVSVRELQESCPDPAAKKRRPDGAEELAPCSFAVHRLQVALKSVSLETGEGDGAGGAS
ncbi:hypothetical protein MHYP_G00088640 [Metynnis hypsauchen]